MRLRQKINTSVWSLPSPAAAFAFVVGVFGYSPSRTPRITAVDDGYHIAQLLNYPSH
jgi:hypothetical protein